MFVLGYLNRRNDCAEQQAKTTPQGLFRSAERSEIGHVEETGGNCVFLKMYSNPQRPLELILSFLYIKHWVYLAYPQSVLEDSWDHMLTGKMHFWGFFRGTLDRIKCSCWHINRKRLGNHCSTWHQGYFTCIICIIHTILIKVKITCTHNLAAWLRIIVLLCYNCPQP